jgi:MYXO-CTERM domain-containing protein
MTTWGKFFVPAAIAVAACSARVEAATVWNESLQGDLSGNRTAPSLVALLPGDNDVIATTQGGDQEYFRITVPTSAQLTGIALRSYSAFDLTFIGVQQGATFTVDPSFAQPGDMYGYTHIGPGHVNSNILDDMGQGFGAQGFTPPLPAGTYTFWVQQLSGATTYDLNFQVALVPEPAAVGLVLVCLAGLTRRRRS